MVNAAQHTSPVLSSMLGSLMGNYPAPIELESTPIHTNYMFEGPSTGNDDYDES